MPIGRVKWFNHRKGFGFIVDDAGNEIFVHYTVIDGRGFRRLREGEIVRYELMQGPKGLCAARVYRQGPTRRGDASAVLAPDAAAPQ
ncbi:MAG: cold-shock protein [Phycisphaerae bacterium]